jgi:chromosomal replication initiator protein
MHDLTTPSVTIELEVSAIDRLSAPGQAEDSTVRRVDVRVGPGTFPDERIEAGSDLTAPLDPRFTFADFVVGKTNEIACTCARRVAEQPSGAGFNPLFLHGGVGLGKTHLMHAIGRELAERPGKPVSVVYLSGEKFMHRFVAAIHGQATTAFKENLHRVDVLMIDDLQFLIGGDDMQSELFHTFNYLLEQGKQIVVSAGKWPVRLSGTENRHKAAYLSMTR